MTLEEALNLNTHWRVAYPVIANAARVYLNDLGKNETITTEQLVGWIVNPCFDDAKRQRVFRALRAMAYNELSGCWLLGIRPKQWFNPKFHLA